MFTCSFGEEIDGTRDQDVSYVEERRKLALKCKRLESELKKCLDSKAAEVENYQLAIAKLDKEKASECHRLVTVHAIQLSELQSQMKTSYDLFSMNLHSLNLQLQDKCRVIKSLTSRLRQFVNKDDISWDTNNSDIELVSSLRTGAMIRPNDRSQPSAPLSLDPSNQFQWIQMSLRNEMAVSESLRSELGMIYERVAEAERERDVLQEQVPHASSSSSVLKIHIIKFFIALIVRSIVVYQVSALLSSREEVMACVERVTEENNILLAERFRSNL